MMNNPTRENPVKRFAFTLDVDEGNGEEKLQTLKDYLKAEASKWTFQLERSRETGHLQYRGHMILNKRKRLSTLYNGTRNFGWHLTAITGNCRDFNYVMEADTRVEGPWKDTQTYNGEIPRGVQELIDNGLYPWEERMCEILGIYEPKKVNVVIDYKGNTGKTTFVKYLRCTKNACRIPSFETISRLVKLIHEIGVRKIYMLDLPRAMEQRNISKLFLFMVNIKSEYLVNTHHNLQEIGMESPHVLIMTPRIPDFNLLSSDLFNFYTIDGDRNLVGLTKEQLNEPMIRAIQNWTERTRDQQPIFPKVDEYLKNNYRHY